MLARAETPPRRSKEQGTISNDWTSSPVSQPRPGIGERTCSSSKPDVVSADRLLSPKQSTRAAKAPEKVDADERFLSPVPALARFGSPASGLQPVPEHGGMMPDTDAWCGRSPFMSPVMTKIDAHELGVALHKVGLLSSPVPPGLQHFNGLTPPVVSVKNTFIQFESPAFHRKRPATPKSVPASFAANTYSLPKYDLDLQLSPSPWCGDENSPPHWFADKNLPNDHVANVPDKVQSTFQKGEQQESRAVQLADFLNDLPAFGPWPVAQGGHMFGGLAASGLPAFDLSRPPFPMAPTSNLPQNTDTMAGSVSDTHSIDGGASSQVPLACAEACLSDDSGHTFFQPQTQMPPQVHQTQMLPQVPLQHQQPLQHMLMQQQVGQQMQGQQSFMPQVQQVFEQGQPQADQMWAHMPVQYPTQMQCAQTHQYQMQQPLQQQPHQQQQQQQHQQLQMQMQQHMQMQMQSWMQLSIQQMQQDAGPPQGSAPMQSMQMQPPSLPPTSYQWSGAKPGDCMHGAIGDTSKLTGASRLQEVPLGSNDAPVRISIAAAMFPEIA